MHVNGRACPLPSHCVKKVDCQCILIGRDYLATFSYRARESRESGVSSRETHRRNMRSSTQRCGRPMIRSGAAEQEGIYISGENKS